MGRRIFTRSRRTSWVRKFRFRSNQIPTSRPSRTKSTVLADLASMCRSGSALEVYTREQLPQDWAETQNNLGSALQEQGDPHRRGARHRVAGPGGGSLPQRPGDLYSGGFSFLPRARAGTIEGMRAAAYTG